MILNCKILFFLVLLYINSNEVSAHKCETNNGTSVTYYTDTNSEINDNEYVLNTTENLKIIDEVHDKMKFLSLSASLQDFMEKVLVLGKYHKLNISIEDLQSFLLFVLDSTKMEDLYRVRDYWMRQLKTDELLKNRTELINHILLKQAQVNKFIEESFERCKSLLIKVKTKETFYDMLDFYGKNDYPGIACLCIYFFDGLKFDRDYFSFEIFSEILFERLKKEAHYFGLPLKEIITYEIDD